MFKAQSKYPLEINLRQPRWRSFQWLLDLKFFWELQRKQQFSLLKRLRKVNLLIRLLIKKAWRDSARLDFHRQVIKIKKIQLQCFIQMDHLKRLLLVGVSRYLKRILEFLLQVQRYKKRNQWLKIIFLKRAKLMKKSLNKRKIRILKDKYKEETPGYKGTHNKTL